MTKRTIFGVILLCTFAVLSFELIFANSESPERASPSQYVTSDNVEVYSDHVTVNVKDAAWAEYADTNSMDPVLDSGAKGIEIMPKEESELSAGDIVSYVPSGSSDLIVHRIVNISQDNLGTFYTLKGDNNSSSDPEKVRFNQIKYKTIMIIY